MPVTIDTRNSADRWRYTCPNGHRNWEAVNNHFWCQSCAQRNWTEDPEFADLHDVKTGERVARERVRLV
ncbi:hypothetical protein ACFQH6_03895 [Halobacteriaceae archaeon GCM10025711]